MADKSFGVKELNLLNASGTPTVTSPNNLNLNANTVAISTSATVGNNLTVSGQINVGSNIKIGNAGVVTATSFVGSGANLTGISAGISTDPSNVQATWKLGGGSGSGFTFTGPGQDGSEGNPDIYLVRGQRYLFDNTTLANSHPFEFRNEANNADYTDGVSGAQNGLQYINVQHDAPAALKYRCTIHTSSMLGNIYIVGQHLANGANDRILTATSAYGMNGEANLTWDASALSIKGSGEGGPYIYRDQGNGPDIVLHGSRGTIASPTASAGTDLVGNINFAGYDGSSYFRRASINGLIDDTVVDGTDTVPTALIFKTGTTVATERLRIKSDGDVIIGSGNGSPWSYPKALNVQGPSGSILSLYNADTTTYAANTSSAIELKLLTGNTGNQSGACEIRAVKTNGTNGDSTRHLSFWTGGNGGGNGERMRITGDGYCKFTSDGTYDGYSNASQAHEFRQSLNKPTLWCSNSSSAQTWEIIRAESARSNSSAFGFISCTSGNLTDDEFRVRGDGQVYADGSFNSGGADYAEYFEWTDGNSSNEDRRGMTVVLDGNKVKLSTSSDSTDNIIGVVSGNASVIGDAASEKWTDKYLRDDYGTYQRDENGERKLNPSYNDTKTYVSREDRQEWDAIGMVGKLRIRKGQTTGTRWIKMRDISDTVEEWLVR